MIESGESSWNVLPYISDLVTWVLVVLGWMVVSDQNEQRELSKNGYARIVSVRDDLKLLEKRAVSFHTSSFNSNDMNALARAISKLTKELSLLQKHEFVGLSTSMEAVALRRAMTLTNFEEPSHSKQSAGSPVVQGIEEACDSLDRQLIDTAHALSKRCRRLTDSIVEVVKKRI